MIRVGNSPIHGRGLFATEDIHPAKIITTNPVLALETYDGLTPPLDWYVFEGDNPFEALLVLSPISLLNHAENPNCEVLIPDDDPQNAKLLALQKIRKGEELTITYGEAAEDHGVT